MDITWLSDGDWLNHCLVSVSSDKTCSLILLVFSKASINSINIKIYK
jgi:hypothetical protein